MEGGPSQDDDPGLILYCGRRLIFTMVEGPWPNTTQKARVSFNVHNDRRSLCNDRRSLCNDRRSLLNTARDLGGAVSPPEGPEQSPGGGTRGEAPGSSENLAFYSNEKEA